MNSGRPASDRSPRPAPDTPPTNVRRRVVFVSYGALDTNSGGHVCGFANGLAGLGHSVAVCGVGDVDSAHSHGEPRFAYFTVDDFAASPEAVIGFDGGADPAQTVILCWTPREIVRRAVEPVAERFGIPYLVHLEDNEEHLTKVWRDSGILKALRRKSVPPGRSDPARLAPFLAGAAGVTMIEPRLSEVVPATLPSLALYPGVDLAALGKPLLVERKSAIRNAMGAPAEAPLIVYPGNVHRANVDEMRTLYEAVVLLAGRGVVLVRTGTDFVNARFVKSGPETGVIALGQVERPFLNELLRCADLFVQPGSPGPFNDFRLPSKLPEFFAVGRPVVLPATNVGARLRDRVDAMLLHEGTAEEIAAQVAAVLDDPALAARLSANARAHAERFYRWDEQTQKLAAFIDQVVV